jgi:hypothetical protein
MSYFVVLSGANASNLSVAMGRLVPIAEAQTYLVRLQSSIQAVDGGPCFFWDDGETGTSEELFTSLEESLLDATQHKEHAIFKALRDCETLALNVRLWTATDDLQAFSHVPILQSAEEAIALLRAELMINPRLGFTLHPEHAPTL